MKKIFSTAALFFSLSASVLAQEPTEPPPTLQSPQTRCKVAREKLGEGQPIHVFFNYMNWATYSKTTDAEVKTALGYALIKNSSFDGDSSVGDETFCASNGTNTQMQLRVYIKPQIADIPKTFNTQFFLPFTIDFKGASDPKNPFQVTSTSLNDVGCREVMREVTLNYYFKGFVTNSVVEQPAQSNFFLRAGPNGSASQIAIENEVHSYCGELINSVVKTLTEQYTF